MAKLHHRSLRQNGWVLSPAYDVNPDPNGDGLKLNISESDNSQDLDLARDVAEYFRLNKDKAEKIIKEVVGVVKNWEKVASHVGISAQEQVKMKRAFCIAEKEKS
jgi:serine/threonine-protein kinase HipA